MRYAVKTEDDDETKEEKAEDKKKDDTKGWFIASRERIENRLSKDWQRDSVMRVDDISILLSATANKGDTEDAKKSGDKVSGFSMLRLLRGLRDCLVITIHAIFMFVASLQKNK